MRVPGLYVGRDWRRSPARSSALTRRGGRAGRDPAQHALGRL